jgi:hypothetical protein
MIEKIISDIKRRFAIMFLLILTNKILRYIVAGINIT